ncbi:hypothetical protein [Shewanella fidelis]|uniref:Uncharacterized protein n=1 Tax=Shewanella fidelis TaxID=173509 RepID=A0AAW8NJW6_9GAMM|nr:hypothetical protein [Shewanella fidelis]MDR8523147.1 hypothetical protein [Shewanella fidelis]MDW4811527.1 hypothetical protein [Shewanella fidelis]MDW4815648.1 hypothetical protein [Shewanella fidelis]MDW4819738.1 hypothetical protein [Shewanella fidelis]MDW4824288.1 hypothetical protein [Shewanella fidelis]
MNGVTTSAGLNVTALLAAIKEASFIVLHAAIYSNFANSEVGETIRQQLINGRLQQLDIIELKPHPAWQQEFAAILRPQMPTDSVEQLFVESSIWGAQLQAEFALQVNRSTTQALPLQPILLVGDSVFVGQYAHSTLTSAAGLWLQLHSPSLGLKPHMLQHWYRNGSPTELSGNYALAISRYVEECRQAAAFYAHSQDSVTRQLEEGNK